MKRILWLSQHQPLGAQVERLRAKFGADVKVEMDTKTFTNAEDLVQRFNRGKYDDWVVVGPLSVLGRMCELCEELKLPKPLVANMQLVYGQTPADLQYRGRAYKFLGFRRVKRLVLEYGEEF